MSELWDKIKQPNVCLIAISEEGRTEKVFKEIMTEKFPNLEKQ